MKKIRLYDNLEDYKRRRGVIREIDSVDFEDEDHSTCAEEKKK